MSLSLPRSPPRPSWRLKNFFIWPSHNVLIIAHFFFLFTIRVYVYDLMLLFPCLVLALVLALVLLLLPVPVADVANFFGFMLSATFTPLWREPVHKIASIAIRRARPDTQKIRLQSLASHFAAIKWKRKWKFGGYWRILLHLQLPVDNSIVGWTCSRKMQFFWPKFKTNLQVLIEIIFKIWLKKYLRYFL